MSVRKNVYKLAAGDTTLQWYGKAVLAMKKRATADPRSWNYQAAMHGFDPALSIWKGIGPLPTQSEQNQFWKQCQHGSWFFFPWHRMYLACFEQIVAQTIVELGGPSGWSLPFWNYSDASNPKALKIPTAFTTPGNATNGLWIKGRINTTIDARYVNLEALDTRPYTGDGRTAPLGFGGPETPFAHSGNTHGELEGSIHDNIHSIIGGAMGDPRTAGLDPIFWLHHANIDRLWQVWLNMGNRTNPVKSSWLNFAFEFHDKSSHKVTMKVSQVLDTRKVLAGYTYQDVPPGVPTLTRMNLMAKVDFSKPFEVVAASNQQLRLNTKITTVHLNLNAPVRKRANFTAIEKIADDPQVTTLHFENITGKGVPPIHNIYLNVPEDEGDKEAYYAGAIGFFGVEEASTPSLHQSGSGQNYVLNITGLMNKLRSLPNWNDEQLIIRIEATRSMAKGTSVKIGRISLYSE